MHAKSRVMRQNWRYINMVTKSQLKVDKITENLSVCDSSDSMHINNYNKGVKQSESLLKYFIDILCFITNKHSLKNLQI